MTAHALKKEIYLVEGMTCSACERTVQRVIENIAGVKTSRADLKSASVTVEYDPSSVDVDKIKSAVSKVGYKFMGSLPPYGQREGNDEAIA
ncbi:MAG TPA: heavy-metal-associated domain-containing protein [Ohtaekwangia sp.]|nr:heavy-metal-associated domain-containing protein [Ohtaekwangia sp.]